MATKDLFIHSIQQVEVDGAKNIPTALYYNAPDDCLIGYEALSSSGSVLNIIKPTLKRCAQKRLGFLSRAEVQVILGAPAADTWSGQRDRVLFQLLYHTGARVSEIINARVEHLRDDHSLQVLGKGRSYAKVVVMQR